MLSPTLDAADTAVDEGTAADRHLPEQRARLSGLAAICRVDGCGTSLAGEKRFYRRSRCCKAHALAETVYLTGEAKRFCQQCCGFHDVAAFDGPRRSCRERLAAHKDRQRRKWQASHGRRGSDSGSSGNEDASPEAQEEQPTTVTRAGRPSRRPSLLRASTNTNTSTDSGTSPERRQAAAADGAPLQQWGPPGGTFPASATAASPHSQGSFKDAGYADNALLYGGGGGGHAPEHEQHQQQRLPHTAFQQAMAMPRRHSTLLADQLPQHGHGVDRLRARRSASMSQVQAQELPSSAEFWLGEHGEPLAPPQHPRNAAGPDGIPSDEVSWFPDLQAWHRSPTRGRHGTQEADTEAALWSRRPTKRRSVPIPEASALAAEAAEAAGSLWPPQHQAHQDLGFGATLGPLAAGSPHLWADAHQPLHRQQQHPPPLAVPQQQWSPAVPVHRDEGLAQSQHFSGAPFDRRVAAAAAEPPSACSQAPTTSAMDYNWEASVAAMNMQQGMAAMAVHGSPCSDHQQDRQELAAAEELHRQANAVAEALPSSLGLSNEAEAHAFASQAPEPLWLAQQLVGATMENKHRPLYSYSLSDALHPLTIAGGQQPAALPRHGRHSQPQHAWQARPPLQHTGRFASASAPDFTNIGHTNESMHGAARAAQHQHHQQQAAERLRQNQQAAWAAQQAGMEARQAEVLAVQQALHAEYRSMQRQLAGVADDQWGARGAALPSAHSPNTVKRVSWSAGVNQFGAARSPGTPPVAPLAMSGDVPLQGGWAAGPRGQRSPVNRPASAQLRPPVSPPQQPQHRPNSAM